MALSDNLQGWWCPSLDTAGNGTTTLTDLSGNGANGTLTNMDAATDWVADTNNGGVRALYFDGISAKVPTALIRPARMDVAIWFAALDFNNRALFGQLRTSPTDVFARVLSSTTINAGFGNFSITVTVPPLGSSWHMLGVSLRASEVKLWLDGVSIGTQAIGENPDFVDEVFQIGMRRTSLQPWSGLIDGCAVWNRNLTDDEISQIYNGGRSLNLLSTGTTQSIVPQLLLRRRRMSGGGLVI